MSHLLENWTTLATVYVFDSPKRTDTYQNQFKRVIYSRIRLHCSLLWILMHFKKNHMTHMSHLFGNQTTLAGLFVFDTLKRTGL